MKLINKITIWFLGVMFLVTPVTMLISRANIKRHLDQAEIARMKAVNDHVYQQLLAGAKPDHYTHGRPVEISLYQGTMPAERVQTIKDVHLNEDLAKNECRITVTSYYPIGSQIYRISSYNYVLNSEEIFAGMLNTVVWKMLLMILCVALTARFLSKIILTPFNRTIRAIKHFDLKKNNSIQLPHTTTREFRELNAFVGKMTDKARADYAAVKEFSENASHELQTPLAVVRSKLDLLSQTDIDEKQAQLIGDMQTAIERLSHINRSLVLLTKLENQEFKTAENIKFCTVTRRVLATYEDWIRMKEITLRTNLDKNIPLNIHPALAEILISNLVSNAIRHNKEEGGYIHIDLCQQHFTIVNTGNPPELPTDEMFHRFKKGNQSNDSTGLGLAIVKQICEVNDLTVTYKFANGWHQVQVCFSKPKTASADEDIHRQGTKELKKAEVF